MDASRSAPRCDSSTTTNPNENIISKTLPLLLVALFKHELIILALSSPQRTQPPLHPPSHTHIFYLRSRLQQPSERKPTQLLLPIRIINRIINHQILQKRFIYFLISLQSVIDVNSQLKSPSVEAKWVILIHPRFQPPRCSELLQQLSQACRIFYHFQLDQLHQYFILSPSD